MKKNKVNYEDLENLKLLIFKKIEEFKLACNKKFADKNDTANNFKILDEKIRLIYDEINSLRNMGSNNKTSDNWLLAKKPFGANWCASCENYLGGLNDNKDYVNWNNHVTFIWITAEYKTGKKTNI